MDKDIRIEKLGKHIDRLESRIAALERITGPILRASERKPITLPGNSPLPTLCGQMGRVFPAEHQE